MRMRYFVAGSLLIVGIVAIVQAQPGGGRGFGFGGPQFLIGQKAVQEDLKVTEAQAEKLKDVTKDFGFGGAKLAEIYKDAGIEFGKGGGFGKISDEDREKRDKAQAKVRDEAYKVLGDILNKDQIERLKQIERQQLGIRAFSDAEVESALKLTDSQKTSVKGISGDFDKERREIVTDATKDNKKGKFGGFQLDPETTKKINKVQKEAIGKVTDLLDDSQKAKWKELIGAEFDLSKLQTGFGGFGKDKKKD
jgi:hypothetical protein